MKQSYKQIPRKWRPLACQCWLVGRKWFSCWICDKIVKMHLKKSPKCLYIVNKVPTKWRFWFPNVTFFQFYPTDLVNTKTTIPSGSVNSARYLPRRFASRSMFTSPSGDSCIIFHTKKDELSDRNFDEHFVSLFSFFQNWSWSACRNPATILYILHCLS